VRPHSAHPYLERVFDTIAGGELQHEGRQRGSGECNPPAWPAPLLARAQVVPTGLDAAPSTTNVRHPAEQAPPAEPIRG
jgi:hypothetical protein